MSEYNEGIILFDRAQLVQMWQNAQPIFEQYGTHHTLATLSNGEFFEGGEPLDENGRTEEAADATGKVFFPSDKFATTPAPRTLILVGDDGVYIIPNNAEKSAIEANVIVYGLGFNPNVDEGFYERKREVFGGDDGSITFPVDWIDAILNWTDRYVGVVLASDGGVSLQPMKRKPRGYDY